MDEWDSGVTDPTEWRERSRGLIVALTACLALWIVAILLVARH